VGVSGTGWKETWTILSCMMPFGPTVGGATSSVRLTVVVEGVVDEGKGLLVLVAVAVVTDEAGGGRVGADDEGGAEDFDLAVLKLEGICWLERDGLRLARWPCVCVCPPSRCITLAWGLFAAPSGPFPFL